MSNTKQELILKYSSYYVKRILKLKEYRETHLQKARLLQKEILYIESVLKKDKLLKQKAKIEKAKLKQKEEEELKSRLCLFCKLRLESTNPSRVFCSQKCSNDARKFIC